MKRRTFIGSIVAALASLFIRDTRPFVRQVTPAPLPKLWELTHRKHTVVRRVKRGLSDFYVSPQWSFTITGVADKKIIKWYRVIYP